MPTPRLDPAECQHVLDVHTANGRRHSKTCADLKQSNSWVSTRLLRAKILNLVPGNTAKAQAAKIGDAPEYDMTHQVPDGFMVKGTSTLYDAGGNLVQQWVKSTADQERQLEIMREAIKGLADDVPRVSPVKAPTATQDHLMACYPVGDHHLGMLSWAPETGANYDISIAENLLAGATDSLVLSTPKCATCAIVLLGDFMHYDSFVAVTPSNNNPLDADGRFPKMVRAAIRSIRRMVEAALKHHGKVLLIIEIGNHDIASSIFLMECMAAFYESEPRVEVDTSPQNFHYFNFGKCLVGTHHGHGVKMQQLPLIMATDKPELWGKCDYRYWWTGHIHHHSAQDYSGCTVESFRVLAPTDAWAANKGFRSQRGMKAIVLHKEYGEVARHSVNPAMLEAV